MRTAGPGSSSSDTSSTRPSTPPLADGPSSVLVACALAKPGGRAGPMSAAGTVSAGGSAGCGPGAACSCATHGAGCLTGAGLGPALAAGWAAGGAASGWAPAAGTAACGLVPLGATQQDLGPQLYQPVPSNGMQGIMRLAYIPEAGEARASAITGPRKLRQDSACRPRVYRSCSASQLSARKGTCEVTRSRQRTCWLGIEGLLTRRRLLSIRLVKRPASWAFRLALGMSPISTASPESRRCSSCTQGPTWRHCLQQLPVSCICLIPKSGMQQLQGGRTVPGSQHN